MGRKDAEPSTAPAAIPEVASVAQRRQDVGGDDLEHLDIVVELVVQEDALHARIRVLADAGDGSIGRADDEVDLRLISVCVEGGAVGIERLRPAELLEV